MHETFAIIENFTQDFSAELNNFFQYFRKTWMNHAENWIVHGEKLRTNNDLEVWHYSVSKLLSGKHVDISKFLDFIRDEEHAAKHLIIQTDLGKQVKRKRPKYQQISIQLSKITEEYVNGERGRLSFLKGCAMNLAKRSTCRYFNSSDSEDLTSLKTFPHIPHLLLDSPKHQHLQISESANVVSFESTSFPVVQTDK